MARYTPDSKDRVREAVDFVELVSARTELRRAGANRYEGLCPFHEERTPSFGIDPVQKVYYCFGCQASGDVFTFVCETEGLDFKAGLELLAERYGVELQREAEDPHEEERRRRSERLLELLDRTAGYYERYLWESDEAAKARDYLQARGLSEAALREFRVGYAPSAWDRVLLASRRGGFSVPELYAVGLAQRSKQNGQPYDRFRARIMFPLANSRGRVVGFGARAMREDQRPKYLNTSDNDVYHKGRHLYGADLARPHAARVSQVIVCEGYTDTIALHQAQIRNSVGLMGTALTDEQVGELALLGRTVLMALDADAAGQEAMLRASKLAAARGLELRVVEMPAGSDPAELLQRGGAAPVEAAIAASVPFARFRVQRELAAGDDGTAEGRDRTIERLRPVFDGLPQSAMRAELTQLVSSRLALPGGLAEQLLQSGAGTGQAAARGRGESQRGSGGARGGGTSGGDARGGAGAHGGVGQSAGAGARAGGTGARNGSRGGAEVALARRDETERAFLALCIASPEDGARVLAELDIEETFASALVRRAARHLRDGHLRSPMDGLASAEGAGEAGGDQDDAETARLTALLAELVVKSGYDRGAPAMLEAQRLQLELVRLERNIQQARGGAGADVSALATRRGEVQREFDAAYAKALEETGGE